MSRKRSIGLIIICLAAILYGILDIGQVFMPTVTGDRVEYSIPLIGALLLAFSIGTLAMKDWARRLMIFACMYAIFETGRGLFYDTQAVMVILSVIFIVLFVLVIFYLTRPRVRMHFKKKESRPHVGDVLSP